MVQRPARRHGAARDKSWSFSPRTLFGYVPSALKFVLVILALVTVFVGYRVAASASLFQVRGIDVTGTARTSAEEIEGLTRRAVAKTGVWRADLSAITAVPTVRKLVDLRIELIDVAGNTAAYDLESAFSIGEEDVPRRRGVGK